MGRPVIKAAPDVDLYMEWSSIAEMPRFVGNREDMLLNLHAEFDPQVSDLPEVRLQRADDTGTSSKLEVSGHPAEGAWDDHGLIVGQKGWLPRSKFAEFMRLWRDNRQAAYKLLEPFED